MIHIWHEDSKESVTQKFWEFLREQKVLAHLGKVEIRAFGSNSNLVAHLKECTFTSTDIYYIFIDYVLDNPKVLRLIREAKSVISGCTNIELVPLLCFEYLLLQSDFIQTWACPRRTNNGYRMAVQVRKVFLQLLEQYESRFVLNNDTILNYLCQCYNVTDKADIINRNFTSEQVATLLLHNMLNSLPANFEVTKTKWGSCWTCNCCNNSKGSLFCNVYNQKWNTKQKANMLYTKTRAKEYIERRNK